MSAVKKTWINLCDLLRFNWNALHTAIGYYASMHVIFYTEVAIILLCCVDLTLNCSFLIVISLMSGRNYAYSHTVFAIHDGSNLVSHFWDELYIITLALHLLESIIRIYYCLKLAYHHQRKVTEGDLCCLKCHEPLMSAAMSGVCVVSHFISALGHIIYCIVANSETAWNTLDYHKQYFSNSPFVGHENSSAMSGSMFYKLGESIIGSISNCRYNTSVGVDVSTRQLLDTGDLLSVVKYECALEKMHCSHARFYLQLAMESVCALINYTVIRCLFGHVINMHQYEVYNLQTRLQTRGGSRIIRVYKVRQNKTQRQAGRTSGMMLMQLPRQALRSLINLGSSVAARIRSSAKIPAEGEFTEASQISLMAPPSEVDQQLDGTPGEHRQELTTMDTESDEASWSEQEPEEVEAFGSDSGSQVRVSSDANQKPHLYNRRVAAGGKRVNFEHLRINDLYPTIEPRQHLEQPASAQEDAGHRPIGSATRIRLRSPRANRKVDDSIFTDETFYSLQT